VNTAAYQIARNTFRESLRQPIVIILLLSTLFLIIHAPSMALFSFREQVKLVTDGSLAAMLLGGWTTAVLCASYAVSREIECGTALLVLSKPISRLQFISAKIAGVLAVLVLFCFIVGAAVLLAVRMAAPDQFRFDMLVYGALLETFVVSCAIGGALNYLRRVHFGTGAFASLVVHFALLLVIFYFLPEYKDGRLGDKQVGFPINLVKAVFLVGLGVTAMGALATALSTRLNAVSNFFVCFFVFLLGLASDYLYSVALNLKTLDIAHALHDWMMPLFPIILLSWLIVGKRFGYRENTRIRPWQMHGTFAIFTAAIGVRLVANRSLEIGLTEPSVLMHKLAAVGHGLVGAFAAFAHAITPNWQLFWMADALVAERDIPASYLAYGTVYVCFFILIFTVLAFLGFQNREIGNQAA
jgi:hypothetical protein